MNKLIIVAVLAFAGNAFAEDHSHGKAAPKAAAPAAKEAATTTTTTTTTPTTPMNEADATKACAESKAKDMKACVAEKTGKTNSKAM